MSTTILIIIVVLLIVLYYLSLYAKPPPPPYDIIQCSIEKLTPSLLAERQLIVVSEPIPTPEKLLETVFAYQYIKSSTAFIEPLGDMFTTANSKHTLITSPFWDIELEVATPEEVNNKNKKYIKLSVAKHQVIIIPPFWSFRSRDKKIKRISLDDPLSIVAFAIFSNQYNK